ncbi:LuxR C-terminal-related transcriptional regulator [Streptomyces sp. NPDC060223]|uniref:helix-turn-helix transcriptional regulator n=1 Tax=Streptomyces sp. NPDC060223 TaxID=3347077 RepID=UPI003657BB4F
MLRAAHGDRHAAAELASLLTERQLTGLDPLPARPPALLRAYRQEVRALPDSTRFLLLLAAADQHPVATQAYLRAVTAARLDTRHLDAAEAAGLAHATADGIVFRDPWTRIAVYETVPPSDRREVHQLLARVLRGEGEEPRRAWHQGAAALGPSRRLAARLRVAADLARATREHALACALLERAAALAPDPRERTHLLARAATDAWHSGDTDRARRLAAATPDDALSGLLALRAGNATDAFDALLTAAARCAVQGASGATDELRGSPAGAENTRAARRHAADGGPAARGPGGELPEAPVRATLGVHGTGGELPEAPVRARPGVHGTGGELPVVEVGLGFSDVSPVVDVGVVGELPVVEVGLGFSDVSPVVDVGVVVELPVVEVGLGFSDVSSAAGVGAVGELPVVEVGLGLSDVSPVAEVGLGLSDESPVVGAGAVGELSLADGGPALSPDSPVDTDRTATGSRRPDRDRPTAEARLARGAAAVHLLARVTEAAVYTGDLRRCREAVAVADRLGIVPPGTLGGLAAAFEGRYEDARDLLEAAAGRCGPGGDPTLLIHAAIAALLLGDHARASAAALRAAASARARGETVTVPQAMEFRAYAEFWTGRSRAAEADTLDALRQAYATGQDNGACHLQAALAMFAALTGDEDVCRERAESARSYALARGLGLPAALALFALAFLDLGAGRFAASAARLRALAGFGPGHGHRAIRHIATPLYVEAAVRSGDTRVARAAHAAYDRWARTVRSADDLALSARCHALLASGPEAVEHYRTALDLHAAGTRDFERARTELLFGGALRRLRHRTEARDRLHSALEAFEHFGSAPCAAQARAELRALGEPALPARGQADLATRLTAQQLMVARMAAEGATNREIAARLALSPRTIDHHLRGVFARLGIRSRIELVRLIGEG